MNKKIPLKKIATYSKQRINCSELNFENYIGTDNLKQNKLGKEKAQYIPKKGNVTKYNKGDILIANIRPYLKKIWYATNLGGSSADVLTLRVNNKYNSKFVYYSLFRNDFFNHMMIGSKGTRMPRGNKDQVLDFLIPDFHIKDQQKIASVLSALDSKIELNNKINTELEKMAKTLYDYWFVQFDFPDENGKPYKSSGGKMVWSDELKREIPKNWSVKKLGDVCEIYQPQTISEKDCIKNGKYFVHGSNGIIGKYYKYNHKESEIIISCRGDCGNIHRTLPKTWITGNAMVFRMLDKSIYNEFLYQALRHSGIKNISSGSVQGQITRTNVSPLKIILPEKKIIDKFSKISKNIVSKKLLINEENQKLAELRDWLLPLLMNGQVKVK
jgi:type I restriction enzyme S subunit